MTKIEGYTQIYKMSSNDFDKGKTYWYGYYNKKIGEYPNEEYFTDGPLAYIGKYIGMETKGFRFSDAYQEKYFFNDNGNTNTIELGKDARVCFIESK